MFRVQVKNKSVQMSKEYFIDFLNQLNIQHSINKNMIEIKTPKEIFEEAIPFPIDLEDSEIFRLMIMAHENNITFNDFCNKILREEIEKIEKTKPSKKNKK
jgi:hypothetical protein